VKSKLLVGGARPLIDIDALGAGAGYAGLSARLYAGAPLGHAPAYDGNDVWPVRPESLNDPGDVTSARLEASDTYVVGDTRAGRFKGDLTVELPTDAGVALHLRIHDPAISMQLDPARGGARSGTLAGVLATATLRDETLALASSIAPLWFCSG